MALFLLTWVVATFGFINLATTMDKHQKQFLKVPLSLQNTKIVKYLGWLLLLVALVISVSYYDIADGISYWIGILCFSGLFVLSMLSYFPHLLKTVVACLLIVALISIVTMMF